MRTNKTAKRIIISLRYKMYVNPAEIRLKMYDPRLFIKWIPIVYLTEPVFV